MCVRLQSESSEPTILFSQTTPDEHPPTPPPSWWPALFTLPTLAKFQLVWRRLCGVVLFASCLVKYGFTDAPLWIEYCFQVTRVAPSTLHLRSRGRPSLPPPCVASSFLPLLLRPRCLASSFLHCLTSSIPVYPTLLPQSSVHPPASRRLDRVEFQSKQLIWRSFNLIWVWYTYKEYGLRLLTTVSSPAQCVNHFVEDSTH